MICSLNQRSGPHWSSGWAQGLLLSLTQLEQSWEHTWACSYPTSFGDALGPWGDPAEPSQTQSFPSSRAIRCVLSALIPASKHKGPFVSRDRALGSLLYSPKSLPCGVGRFYEIETRQLRAQLASHWVTWFSLEPPPSNHAFDQQLPFRFLVPQELSPLAWHKALSLLAFQILRKQKLFPLPPTLVSPLVGTGVSIDSRTQRVAPLDISRSGLSNFSLRPLLGCLDTLVLGAASDVQVFSDWLIW